MKKRLSPSTAADKAARRNKARLAFDSLEKEMETLTPQQANETKGGSGWGDCVIEAIAFATGMDYNDVLDAYGQYMASTYGGNAGAYELDIAFNGISAGIAGSFAQTMGLSNSGDTPQGPSGYSVSGDCSVAFLSAGGSGHAVVLTGNASATEYYYYDPQNHVTGTISKSSASIVGTYGY